MKRLLGAALCAAMVIGIAGVSTTAVAQSGDEKPKATDVGITDNEIHIAVIADVDNPIVPEPVQGVEGRGRRRRRST